MRKTKLCLDLGVDLDDIEIGCDHSCSKCGYLLNDDKTMDVFHNLPSIEVNLPTQGSQDGVALCCWLCCPKRSSNR